MKKVLMVEFEHSEKKPDGFNAALAEFLRHVLTVGYRVTGKWIMEQVATAQPVPEAETVTYAGPLDDEVVALAVETATAVDGPEDVVPVKPPTLKELRAGIKALKAELGGNKILSQVEMAKRLGVSRDRIRQALK